MLLQQLDFSFQLITGSRKYARSLTRIIFISVRAETAVKLLIDNQRRVLSFTDLEPSVAGFVNRDTF
jgi:hypothetical protein